MYEITDEQAAYLAGLIDGEGYIGALVSKYGYVQAGLVVINTHLGVLTWAQAITGIGTVKPKKRVAGHKQAWRWIIGPQPARELLNRIRSYSKIKRMEMHLFCVLAALGAVPINRRRRAGLSYDWNLLLARQITALKH